MKIVAVNGSYRKGGLTDQVFEEMTARLEARGVEVDRMVLRDEPISFCLNCRECTQKPGEAPGECVQDDGFNAMVERLETADGYILASATNFYTATALFKRFLERLVVYGYWPWGAYTPKNRKTLLTKRAVIFSTCAAPSFVGRLFYRSLASLGDAAKVMGAKVVSRAYFGLGGQEPRPVLTQKEKQKARRLADKVLEAR